MKADVRFLGLALAGALLVFAPGCRTSCTYATGDVEALDWGGAAPGFLEPIYVAAPAAPVVAGQDRARDWAELGPSLRRHLVATGLTPASAAPLRGEADAERVLEAARAKGQNLVFVTLNLVAAGGEFHDSIGLLYLLGVAPGLIGYALPIHKEIGIAHVCALVVDPTSDERLGLYWAQATLNEVATGYDYAPAALSIRAVKAATEDVLGQIAKAAREGFPERKAATPDGLATLLFRHGAPGMARIYGNPTGAEVIDAEGRVPSMQPTPPPPGPAASPTGKNTTQFLDHRKELVEGKTTLDEVLALLGAPALDQVRIGRRFFFWVHSQAEGGKVVTRMLSVWFRDGVVDEVVFTTT